MKESTLTLDEQIAERIRLAKGSSGDWVLFHLGVALLLRFRSIDLELARIASATENQ